MTKPRFALQVWEEVTKDSLESGPDSVHYYQADEHDRMMNELTYMAMLGHMTRLVNLDKEESNA
jgi:hypothetical protein